MKINFLYKMFDIAITGSYPTFPFMCIAINRGFLEELSLVADFNSNC